MSAQPPQAWPAVSLAEAHAILTAPGQRLEMDEIVIRGIRTRIWKNLPPTMRELLAFSRAFGSREFIVYENERVTYEGFYRATVTLAQEMRRRGVQKGDRVALVMRNLPEWPVVFYAAGILGAIATPLNAWWTGPELEYGLVDCGAEFVFTDAERLERLSEHFLNCPDLKRIYVSRSSEEAGSPSVAALEDVIGTCADWPSLPACAMPDETLRPDDDATILYTSGTTGRPKGALGTHRNMLSNIFSLAVTTARNFLRRGEPVPVIDPLTAPQPSPPPPLSSPAAHMHT